MAKAPIKAAFNRTPAKAAKVKSYDRPGGKAGSRPIPKQKVRAFK